MDSAGQNLGAEGYLQTVAALDKPLGRLGEACRENNVLLVVTADHGMCFPSARGKGGHSADKYVNRLESLRVPLVFSGPGVEELNLAGKWSEVDIAPTVLDMLNVTESENRSWEGTRIPLKQSYNLRVVGAPGGVALYRGEKLIANATGDGEYHFLGLGRGLYSLRAGERSWQVLMNGDRMLDLTEKAAPPLGGLKKIFGVILILVINLIGAAVIIWIWRRG